MDRRSWLIWSFAIFLGIGLTSCALQRPIRKKKAAKPRKLSADEQLLRTSFWKVEEVYLKISRSVDARWRETKQKWQEREKYWTQELSKEIHPERRKDIARMLRDIRWILRHIYQKPPQKQYRFLGYLETRMKGFEDDRQYAYFVYDKTFTQPIGYYLEGGQTYRFWENPLGELQEEHLGRFTPMESLRRIFGVSGELEIRPLRVLSKGKKGKGK